MSLLMDALKKAEEAKKTYQPSAPIQEALSSDLERKPWEEKNSFLPQKETKETNVLLEEGTEFPLFQKETIVPIKKEILLGEDIPLEQETSSGEKEFSLFQSETIVPIKKEVLLGENIPLEQETSSDEQPSLFWEPWKELPKEEHDHHKEVPQEVPQFPEEAQETPSPPNKETNWDDQWLPEFSETIPTQEGKVSNQEESSTPEPSPPSFTLRDWKSESSEKIDEPKNLIRWSNREPSSINENKDEFKTISTMSDNEPPFSTKFERTSYEQKTKNTQETAQRILAANTSSISTQAKRVYGLLFIVLLILGGGGYYFYSALTAYQGNTWLNTSETTQPFKTPLRNNLPLEKKASISPENNMTDHSLSYEENKTIDRELISNENQHIQVNHDTRPISSPKDIQTLSSLKGEPESQTSTTEKMSPSMMNKTVNRKEDKENGVKEGQNKEIATAEQDKENVAKEQNKEDMAKEQSSEQNFLKRKPSPQTDRTHSALVPAQHSTREKDLLRSDNKEPSSPSSIQKPEDSAIEESKELTSLPKETAALRKPKTAPLPSVTAQEEVHRHKILNQQINGDLSDAYGAFQRGDPMTAQRKYTQALETDQNNRDALLGLAALAMQRGEPSTAQRYYQQILQLYPEDVHAQVGMITTLDYQSTGSEQQLKSLLEQAPQSSYIYFSLGNLYARQGRWTQAQRAYFDAYHYDSTKADYAYNLAISLDQLNQPMAALDYYQKALQLSRNQTINFNLPSVYRRVQTLLDYSNRLKKNFQGIPR